jgi:hypothetical protein
MSVQEIFPAFSGRFRVEARAKANSPRLRARTGPFWRAALRPAIINLNRQACSSTRAVDRPCGRINVQGWRPQGKENYDL